MSNNIYNDFKIEPLVKEEFLSESNLKSSTKKFYSFILKKTEEYETLINKSIYDFNIDEIDDFISRQFKNKSEGVVRSTIAVLINYVSFCISKNLVKHHENRFKLITDYLKYVNDYALESYYITKDELLKMQDELDNPQNKLILQLIFLGIRGRTEKNNSLEELINLKEKDINEEKKEITLTRNDDSIRIISVDDYTLNLLKKAFNADEYIMQNGMSQKSLPINPGEYIFRVPGSNKYSKFTASLFVNRITHMQKWLNKPYLTISNLFFSGMIEYAKELKKKKGDKLEKKDYEFINKHFRYGDGQYWHKTKTMIEYYLTKE